MYTCSHLTSQNKYYPNYNKQMSLLKASIFSSLRQLQRHRAYIEQEQIRAFWQNQSLIKLEQYLTIDDVNIVSYLFKFMEILIKQKKGVAAHQAFYAQKNGQNLLCYDCKMFKNSRFNKEENQLITSFLLTFRSEGKNQFENEQLFQFADSAILNNCTAIVKCKESSILKIPSLFRALKLEEISGDTIILKKQEYYRFIWHWMQFSPVSTSEELVKHLFVGILILVQNNLMDAFYSTLSQKQKEYRCYKKPATIIPKPKLKQSSTMIQEGFGDVKWHTMKMKVFKLKYNVIEEDGEYFCYRSPSDDQELFQDQDIYYDEQFLQQGDKAILQCFERQKIKWGGSEFY